MSTNTAITKLLLRLALATFAALLVAGCGESDPGPGAVGGGELSTEGQRQDYVDGVTRALSQLGSATQGPEFARAVDGGNRKQLQVAALAWQQGGAQLKGLNPPKDAVEGHKALVVAVGALDQWNRRIVAAAPNKAMTKKLARQAGASPASQQFEAAVCQLVDAGYEVVDPGVCTPLANAGAPVG
ncbi:MAG: hypothetical protein JWL76_1062 [Thermoleophilia bacterium]|nr:hypothetical protein [Thermoleophilia bacterium]